MKKEVEEFWNKPENLKKLPVLLKEVSEREADSFLEALMELMIKREKSEEL